MNDLYNRACALALSASDKAVLKEACFLAKESELWASVPTLAFRTGLTDRCVQKVLARLVAAGFLTPSDPEERRFGRGKTKRYQITLPSPETVNEIHPSELERVNCQPEKGERGSRKGERGSPDLKIGTTRSSESLSTPHGAMTDGQLNLKLWCAIKEQLGNLLPETEWNSWVRPAFLLSVMNGGTLQVALPPSGRIIEQARARLPTLRALACAQGFAGAVLTAYPDSYDHQRMQHEFPEQYERWYGKKPTKRSEARA